MGLKNDSVQFVKALAAAHSPLSAQIEGVKG